MVVRVSAGSTEMSPTVSEVEVGQRAAQLLAMPPEQLFQWTTKQQHTVMALVHAIDTATQVRKSRPGEAGRCRRRLALAEGVCVCVCVWVCVTQRARAAAARWARSRMWELFSRRVFWFEQRHTNRIWTHRLAKKAESRRGARHRTKESALGYPRRTSR